MKLFRVIIELWVSHQSLLLPTKLVSITPAWDYIYFFCKHTVSSKFSLHQIYSENKKLYYSFTCSSCSDMVAVHLMVSNKTKLLSTPNFHKVPLGDIRQQDGEACHVLYSSLKYAALFLVFLLGAFVLERQGRQTLLPPCHRCCVSLYDFIINGLPMCGSREESRVNHLKPSVPFWCNFWVNLSANDAGHEEGLWMPILHKIPSFCVAPPPYLF